MTAGTPAYTGHTTSSGGRSSSLSSSQHGHGPSTHQSADFQPPYFPPPFHHSSTHQSPAGTHQQQQARFQKYLKLELDSNAPLAVQQNHHGIDYLSPAADPYGQTPLSSGLHHHTSSLHHHYNQLAGLSRPSQEQLGLSSRSHRDSVDLVQGCHVVSFNNFFREFNNFIQIGGIRELIEIPKSDQ